jgi:hypothetical protein
MAKAVEKELAVLLGNAKGGSLEDGEKELKLLKDRNRLLLDVRPFLLSYLLLDRVLTFLSPAGLVLVDSRLERRKRTFRFPEEGA